MAVRQVGFTITDTTQLPHLAGHIRDELYRKVILLINGKGGVGKTSAATNLAYFCAALGARVLLIELDPQGNHAEDLGFFRNTSINDSGKSLTDAIISCTPLQPTGEVRPHLSVCPGGEHLERLIQELYLQQRLADVTGDPSWVWMLGASLAQSARYYDQIILDVAPGSLVLQLQALVASDMLVIPSRSDPSSRKGLRAVARRVGEAAPFNESLQPLGIILFATGSRSFQIQKTIRESLSDDLGGEVPVFDRPIRYVEAAAVACRTRGLMPQELAMEPDLDESLRKSVVALGTDYRAVNSAILEAAAVLRSGEQI